jgi:hypothetical protein
MAGGGEHGISPDVAEPRTGAADEHVSSLDVSSALEAATHSTSDRMPQARQVDCEPAASDEVKLVLDGFTLDEVTLMNSPLLPYLAMVASVLEHRTISITELLWVLRQSMRQRSFDRLPRREYVLRFLHEHPP